ncbi:unnamed protein product, partial [Prorocentrum cordatum]
AGDEDYLAARVLIDDCWNFCELVPAQDKVSQERTLVSGHKRDSRVAGDLRDPVTKERFMVFSESLGLQHDLEAVVASTVNDFGGFVLPEYAKCIAQIQEGEAFAQRQQR